jgi:hypothetical protein
VLGAPGELHALSADSAQCALSVVRDGRRRNAARARIAYAAGALNARGGARARRGGGYAMRGGVQVQKY